MHFSESQFHNAIKTCWAVSSFEHLALVVQTLDSAIHWINHYPLDNSFGFSSFYPLDTDLSGGQRYPSFEQLGSVYQLRIIVDDSRIKSHKA